MQTVFHVWAGRFHRRAGVSGVLIAALLLPLTAIGQGDNAPITLRLKFKAGEVYRYQTAVQATVSLPGASGKPASTSDLPKQQFSMVQEIKVDKLLPNGDSELTITMQNLQSLVDGQMGTIPPPPPITMTYDPFGKPVAVEAAPRKGFHDALLNSLLGSGALSLAGLSLPNKAVKPGDAWTDKLIVPHVPGNATVKSTFVRVETIGRYKTARLHVVLTKPVDLMLDGNAQPTRQPERVLSTATGLISMTFDINFAITEGKVIRSAGNGSASITLKMKSAGPKPSAVKPGPAPPVTNLTLKTTIGSNLIE